MQQSALNAPAVNAPGSRPSDDGGMIRAGIAVFRLTHRYRSDIFSVSKGARLASLLFF